MIPAPSSSFNPRSPREERPRQRQVSGHGSSFNPRSPREERLIVIIVSIVRQRFQSTLPSRGATRAGSGQMRTHPVSIHAPLARSDNAPGNSVSYISSFNPRSPREERPPLAHRSMSNSRFQSTLPSRGATERHIRLAADAEVSIHAPLARSDRRQATLKPKKRCFNPRSPREERRALVEVLRPATTSFNPRSPREERQANGGVIQHRRTVSIHAPLARSDGQSIARTLGASGFNPRSPREERPPFEGMYVYSDSVSIHAPLARSDLIVL